MCDMVDQTTSQLRATSFNSPDSTLYLTISKDGGILLDVRNDRLLKLNPSGALIWTLLAQGHNIGEIGRRLAKDYDTDERRLCGEVRKLLTAAAELGLDPREGITIEATNNVGSASPAESFPWYGNTESDKRPDPPKLLVFKAFIGLVLFDALLLHSFAALCTRVKQWPARGSAGESLHADIACVCSAVERACVWYPKRALCLQRSAVTTCLLRQFGVPAQMIVGARAMPMAAHAWVEVGGAVVNDWPRVREFYPPLSSY